MHSIYKYLILAGVLLTLPNLVLADDLNGANTAWILSSTALVLFMTIPGLALFYAGLVRSKNVLSVLMHCFSITCLASIVWLVFGYSMSFSDGGVLNQWLGSISHNLFLSEVTRDSLAGDIPESVFVMFQMTFAIITPALVIGGFAERMKFSAVLWFTLLWLALVYFPVCHWVWGGGWLAAMGVLDFAGGLVVHLTAGVGALVAAIVLGKRQGFPNTPLPPHNMTMTVTGAGMLWVGWFGFNGGSALAANGDAGMAILVTHISAAVASITWMTIEWLKYGKPSVLGIVTGMVAGLGSITPASGFVGPLGAIMIGLSAGIICFSATNFMKRTLRIDDSLDVFPVHGVGGIIGTLFVAVLVASQYGGVGLADGMTIASQLKVQLTAVLAVLVWTAIASLIILKFIDLICGLRVNDEIERNGLDISEHEEKGYNI
ncbi:MAG: ammonia channel protein [Gammaproteobacteria bacterium TMED119]|nr:MAG: ammonia channel protein [Gammaproteobacteria bacterium TMED119]|tara:strand:- start:347 stop:1642 length:1296 start_codon:yes stop_codon:yes gene_type:complete